MFFRHIPYVSPIQTANSYRILVKRILWLPDEAKLFPPRALLNCSLPTSVHYAVGMKIEMALLIFASATWLFVHWIVCGSSQIKSALSRTEGLVYLVVCWTTAFLAVKLSRLERRSLQDLWQRGKISFQPLEPRKEIHFAAAYDEKSSRSVTRLTQALAEELLRGPAASHAGPLIF